MSEIDAKSRYVTLVWLGWLILAAVVLFAPTQAIEALAAHRRPGERGMSLETCGAAYYPQPWLVECFVVSKRLPVMGRNAGKTRGREVRLSGRAFEPAPHVSRPITLSPGRRCAANASMAWVVLDVAAVPVHHRHRQAGEDPCHHAGTFPSTLPPEQDESQQAERKEDRRAGSTAAPGHHASR